MKRTRLLLILAVLGVLGLEGVSQRPATATVPAAPDQVIHLTAKKFEYAPNEIILKKGVPVVLEITSIDRDHGFNVPELGIRTNVKPGETTRVQIIPDRIGRFEFHCDVFCGSGHEDMSGELVVVD